MAEDAPTYYDVLGVDEDASAQEIRRAYLRLAAVSHPDKRLDDPNAKETFQEINEAYETLYDEEARATYDDRLFKLRNPLPPTPAPQPAPSYTVPPTARPRPRFSRPPPFHPLFAPPVIVSPELVWLELFNARLNERIYSHKVLHPYWRPVIERIPSRPPPTPVPPPPFIMTPREHVQRMMMTMDLQMRWLAEVKARGRR